MKKATLFAGVLGPGLRAAPKRRRRPASAQPAQVRSMKKAALFAGVLEPGLRAANAAPIN